MDTEQPIDALFNSAQDTKPQKKRGLKKGGPMPPQIWKPGQSGNPAGGKKGVVVSDRALAMKIVFKLMQKHGERFEIEMDKLAEQNIVAFYLKFVAPLQPREFKLDTSDKGITDIEEWLTIDVQARKDLENVFIRRIQGSTNGDSQAGV